ncbi:MAG: hypothetical protein K0U74_16795, partial [Alphaproteobacteria bacterium]|nr:hypothetical protein [Alphaproteobacteria bacterium]
SGAGVVDPTANRRNAVRQSISPHPSGTPHFFASAASRHWPIVSQTRFQHDNPYRAARRFWPNAKK